MKVVSAGYSAEQHANIERAVNRLALLLTEPWRALGEGVNEGPVQTSAQVGAVEVKLWAERARRHATRWGRN